MKNFIKKFFCHLLVILLLAGSPIISQSSKAMNPLDLSEEDKNFLEEAQKQVEQYVSALPSEAQLRAQGASEEQIKNAETKEKFQREVERLSKLSEEDLIKEIEDAISKTSGEQPPAEKPAALPMPVKTEPSVKEEIKQIVPTGKQQAALHLIDSVITSINNFLNKAQIMVELPTKIENWTKENKLRNWPAQLSWKTLKSQVEDLVAKLNKVKDRDPRTNNYKYLDEFIKDEALQNNLMKVKDTLTRFEPKITLSSFGINKMTSEARQAIRTVLLSLYEATTLLAIPTALERIIEKYEPTAKKLKETSEAAQKQALEESRRPRTSGSFSTTGRPPSAARENYPYREDRGGHTYNYSPSYEAPYRAREGRGEQESLLKGQPGQAGGKTGAAGGQAGGQEAKKMEAAKAPEKAKYEADKKADKYEGNFITALESFKEIIDDNPQLKNIEKHITKDKDTLPDERTVDAIDNASKAIRTAIAQAKNLKKHIANLNDAQKKAYKKSIKDSFKDVKSDFENMVTQINSLSKPDKASIISGLNPEQQANFKAKYYSYFNKENGQKYDQDLRKYIDEQDKRATRDKTPLPDSVEKIKAVLNKKATDLSDLKARIVDLKKVVDEI